MRGGQTLEDMESIVESLSCLALAVLSPGSGYAFYGGGTVVGLLADDVGYVV
jgi:hypothetical protein